MIYVRWGVRKNITIMYNIFIRIFPFTETKKTVLFWTCTETGPECIKWAINIKEPKLSIA